MTQTWNKPTQAVMNNMIQFFSKCAELKLFPAAEAERISGSLRYYLGSQFPILNGLFQEHCDSKLKQNFSEYLFDLDNYFSNKKVPYVWWWLLQEEIPSSIQESINQQGFQNMGEFSGILVELQEIKSQQQDQQLTVREVQSKTDYDTFIRIVGEGFQLSKEIQKDFFNLLNSYDEKGVFKHYLGYWDGQPSSTVTSFQHEGVIGLYNGATLPNLRKKGLLTALLERALMNGKLNGCKYGIAQLMSTAMAKGACEKIGFKKVCQLLPYVKGQADTV